jgi:hypothetical protein
LFNKAKSATANLPKSAADNAVTSVVELNFVAVVVAIFASSIIERKNLGLSST